MAHPKMFEDDDPIYQLVRELALAFPAADMKVTHGRPAFFTKKVFAYYGGSVKVDGEYVQHPNALMVKPDPEDRLAFEADPRVFKPAYLGPSGWLAFDLDSSTEPGEITELLDASYRLTAGKRQIAELDGR